MTCFECLPNGKDVEMEKVHCSEDTYNERGEHVEIDLGYMWVCPECDHEEEYIDEPEEIEIDDN